MSASISRGTANAQHLITDQNLMQQHSESVLNDTASEAESRKEAIGKLIDNGSAEQYKKLWFLIPKLETFQPYPQILSNLCTLHSVKNLNVPLRRIFNESLITELQIINSSLSFIKSYNTYCAINQKLHPEGDHLKNNGVYFRKITINHEDNLYFFFRFMNRLDFGNGISEIKRRHMSDLRELIKITSGALKESAEYMLLSAEHGIVESELGVEVTKTKRVLEETNFFLRSNPYHLKTLSNFFFISNLNTLNAEFVYNEFFMNTSLVFDVSLDFLEKIKTLLHNWSKTQDERISCFNANHDEIRKGRPKNKGLAYLQKYEKYSCNYVAEAAKTAALIRESFPELYLSAELADSSTTFPVASSSNESSVTMLDEALLSEIDQPSKKIKCSYSGRVLEWFKTSPKHLERIESYKNLSYEGRKLEHLFHGFSQIVDSYLPEYSYKSVWHNKTTGNCDTVYSIPGKIEFGDAEYWGVFGYAFGADDIIYHRYFTIHTPNKLISLAGEAFQGLQFLSKDDVADLELERTGVYEPPILRGKVKRHRIYNSIHIEDVAHGARLILMPKN